MSLFQLNDKVALITGASRGIGKAIALEVARRGGMPVLTSRNEDACWAIAKEIEAAGHKAFAHELDVTNSEQFEAVVHDVFNRFGRLDALVNNAGTIEPIAPLAETDPDEWVHSLHVNISGVYYGIRTVLPRMIAAGGGTIINISSGAAMRPKDGWSAYSTGKAAVAMLTQAVAVENAQHSIRAYGLQPGVVDTAMQETIRESGINEVSKLRREQLADPAEPAHIVAWLMHEDAADLAGRELTIRDAALRERAGLAQYTGV